MASIPREFAPAITNRDLAGDGKRMGCTKSGRVKPLDPLTLRVRCWVQADRLERMVKLAIIADKLAFLEWNAKEAQRLASTGDWACIASCER